jgi:hypothetical protein
MAIARPGSPRRERASRFGRFGVGSGSADTRTTPMRLLTRLLRGFIKTGTLELIDAHGSRYIFGAAPGPPLSLVSTTAPCTHAWR